MGIFLLFFANNSAFAVDKRYSTTKYSTAEELKLMISRAENEHQIPAGLLQAIVSVESDLQAFALNIAGKPLRFSSLVQVKAKLQELIGQGHRSIDVGLAQLNYRWHGTNFKKLEHMFDPKTNIAYAAALLKELYEKHGSWQQAVRLYHSATPHYHKKYSRKVILAWIGGNNVR